MAEPRTTGPAEECREDLRAGVFVCRCGTNIGGFLDTASVKAYAETLPGVVFTKENLFTCSESGVSEIKNAIREHRLNRVVVAACTPRTHEPTFRAACVEAGLNPFLFEFVNIREQCSWVHKADREAATKKAKDLLRMGVARAALLETLDEIRAPVLPSALVIGGGVAGLTAALSLARRGFEVKVVEKRSEVGGMLRHLGKLYPAGRDAQGILTALVDEARGQAKIEIFTSTEVVDVRGFIGNYRATLRSSDGAATELRVGAILVATGLRALVPEGLFGYDGTSVVTQLAFGQELLRGGALPEHTVMVQCVGSRNRERVYCSRICCMTAIHNALLLKGARPDAEVHILYRDLQCCGVENEALLRKAKALGVRFVAFAEDDPPVVEPGRVRVRSAVLGRELTLPADRVVLSTALLPDETAPALSKILKVPLDPDGFFLEAHVKLRPLDFANDGVYVCGGGHWPVSVPESIAQALGAAGRASMVLGAGEVTVEPIVSVLADRDACRGCGLCASLCPYGAIEMEETDLGRKAKMISVACKGCGVCASTCYRRAIRMRHFTDEQIEAQVSALLKEA